MKLTFFGAARAVTGSCYCVECNDKKVLVDCGLQQGRDEIDNRELDFNPAEIDHLIVTHAHIDHSGRIPLLIKQGFSGSIYCTRLTAQLLSIMLRDSAHIQESDAAWETKRNQRAGKEAVEPLYTLSDAEKTMQHVVTLEYGQEKDLGTGIRLRLADAGHMLGSASAEVWLTEGHETRKIVFSGDIGNKDQPIIRNPQYITEADFVLTESTYGDRLHKTEEAPDYTADLAAIIDETLSKGGNVLIPSFAVGRTQELLYFIREMKQEGLVKHVPNFPVYVDSPLAGEATHVFSGDLHGYLDEDAIEDIQKGALFQFPGLHITESIADSQALNTDTTPKVIISVSGNCSGRIRHHLKHNLWRRESTVVLMGSQSPGSLGARLLEGAAKVKLFGEEVAVRANVANLPGRSSHADQDDLLEWLGAYSPRPRHIFVVHGDRQATETYTQILQEQGFAAHAPEYTEVYDLLADKVVTPGITPARKTAKEEGKKLSAAFLRLEELGRRLVQVIASSRGRSGKDLGRFADQLKALLDKWER